MKQMEDLKKQTEMIHGQKLPGNSSESGGLVKKVVSKGRKGKADMIEEANLSQEDY